MSQCIRLGKVFPDAWMFLEQEFGAQFNVVKAHQSLQKWGEKCHQSLSAEWIKFRWHNAFFLSLLRNEPRAQSASLCLSGYSNCHNLYSHLDCPELEQGLEQMSVSSQEILGHESGWLSNCSVPAALRGVIAENFWGPSGLETIGFASTLLPERGRSWIYLVYSGK